MDKPAFETLRVAEMNEDDRPREKALKNGVETLADAELIAIILGSGFPGMSVVELSRRILRDFDNSLQRLARVPVKELCARYKGLGPVKAVTLAAAIQLGFRVRDEKAVRDPLIMSSNDVYTLMRNRLEMLPHEEFWVLHLTRGNRVKSMSRLSQGGLSSTVIDIPLLFSRVLRDECTRIIVVHNHPSGNNRPSGQDDGITERIRTAGATLDIVLLDHVIVSGDTFYSYRDQGRL